MKKQPESPWKVLKMLLNCGVYRSIGRSLGVEVVKLLLQTCRDKIVERNYSSISSSNKKAFHKLEELQTLPVLNCQKLTPYVVFLVQVTQKHYYISF